MSVVSNSRKCEARNGTTQALKMETESSASHSLRYRSTVGIDRDMMK